MRRDELKRRLRAQGRDDELAVLEDETEQDTRRSCDLLRRCFIPIKRFISNHGLFTEDLARILQTYI